MKTVSFAQNHEDILLDRVFAGRNDGFYIDVGACLPVIHSVTKLFYDRGWHGVNIEPNPTIFEILASDRARDVNLPVGLSNREGTLLFHEVPAELGSSTFSPERTDLRSRGLELIEHRIPVTTLAAVCEQHAPATIDFLKIDAEAHEREIVEGADWGRFRPRIIVVESNLPETWEPLLLSADYLFAHYDGLNRYYVRAEDRELLPRLSAPVSVLDQFEPFEYRCRIEQLEHQVEELQRSIARIRIEEHEHQVEELGQSIARILGPREKIRPASGNAPAALAAKRESLVETAVVLEEMRSKLESTQAELGAARARLALFEGWGPMTVSVVRRLRWISSRLRLVEPLLRRAILLRRELRAAMATGHVAR
jgi:FkbM family methyltransferase